MADNQSVEIPMLTTEISVRVGRDGVWVQFAAENGCSHAFNVEAVAQLLGPVSRHGLLSWAEDWKRQADAMKGEL